MQEIKYLLVIWIHFLIGKTQQGWIPICDVEKPIISWSRFFLQKFWAINKSRDPTSTLKGGHLGTPERIVEPANPWAPSVVRGEDDDSVVHQVVVFQGFDDVTNFSVNTVNHGTKFTPDVMSDVWAGNHVLRGSNEWVVWCGESKVEEQGSIWSKLSLKSRIDYKL